MDSSDIVEHFRILVLEGNPARQRRFERWLRGVPTRVVETPADITRELDSSVVAVCFCQSLLEEHEEAIRQEVRQQNPYCQLVLLASDPACEIPFGHHYDAVIERPISKEDLRSTLDTRVRCGMYGALLKEFYSLSANLVCLQRTDGHEDETGEDRVTEQLRRVREPLEQLRSSLDHEDMKNLLHTMKLSGHSPREPANTTERPPVSKYLPSECSNCGTHWGIDHGRTLGTGVTQLGANVWRCNQCRAVTHNVTSENRRVVR